MPGRWGKRLNSAAVPKSEFLKKPQPAAGTFYIRGKPYIPWGVSVSE